jgi:hypothetical protein
VSDVYDWVPVKGLMMMQRGQRYEVRGPGSVSPSDWATLPLTLEGNSDVSVLGARFHFVWTGETGLFDMPNWAGRASGGAEIRPWRRCMVLAGWVTCDMVPLTKARATP